MNSRFTTYDKQVSNLWPYRSSTCKCTDSRLLLGLFSRRSVSWTPVTGCSCSGGAPASCWMRRSSTYPISWRWTSWWWGKVHTPALYFSEVETACLVNILRHWLAFVVILAFSIVGLPRSSYSIPLCFIIAIMLIFLPLLLALKSSQSSRRASAFLISIIIFIFVSHVEFLHRKMIFST